MEALNQYKIVHSVIDAAGYYGGNMLTHKISSDLPKASATHVVGFLAADLLIRNGTVSMWADKSIFMGNSGRNSYIALVSFLINSGIDLVKGAEAGNAIYKNLILSAVSIPTNSAIDMVLPKDYV